MLCSILKKRWNSSVLHERSTETQSRIPERNPRTIPCIIIPYPIYTTVWAKVVRSGSKRKQQMLMQSRTNDIVEITRFRALNRNNQTLLRQNRSNLTVRTIRTICPLIRRHPELIAITARPNIAIRSVDLLTGSLLDPRFADNARAMPSAIIQIDLAKFQHIRKRHVDPAACNRMTLRITFPNRPTLIQLGKNRAIQILAKTHAGSLLQHAARQIRIRRRIAERAAGLHLNPAREHVP